jgi:hypothetical protein
VTAYLRADTAHSRAHIAAPNVALTRDSADDRVTCSDCSNYDGHNSRCDAFARAGLSTPHVGRVLAQMPQRCPAHSHECQPDASWPAFTFNGHHS